MINPVMVNKFFPFELHAGGFYVAPGSFMAPEIKPIFVGAIPIFQVLLLESGFKRWFSFASVSQRCSLTP